MAAIVRARQFLDLDDLLKDTKKDKLLLALDGVEDPQNLGALLRTAEGAGVGRRPRRAPRAPPPAQLASPPRPEEWPSTASMSSSACAGRKTSLEPF